MPEKLTNEEIALQYFENSESTDEFVVGDDGGFKSTKWGVLDYVKETGKGALLGAVKLDEGITTLRHAAGEKLGIYEEGKTEETIKEFQEKYKIMKERGLYPETMGGQIVGALTQYATPGIGLYGLMSKIIKIPQGVRFVKKILPIAKRALLAEAGTVGLAQTAEDPNVIGGIAEIFQLDTETAGHFAKDFFNYLATTEDTTEGADASQVLESKWKAIIADSPLGLAAEGVMPFLRTFAKVVRDLRGNPSLVKKLEDEVKTAITHADPNAFKKSKTDLGEKAEGFIPGTKEQLQESGNVKTIMKEMNAAKMDFDKLGIKLQDKYNAKWQSRIKDIDRIEEKIATKNISPDKISDYLGGRLMFKNFNDLKRAVEEIEKKYTVIKKEDFFKTVRKDKPETGGYRAIHLQIANKKGQSMELQLRLQGLEKPLKESYKGYTKIRKDVEKLPPELRKIEIKKQNKLKKNVDTAFLKLKNNPGKDFPFKKFIDSVDKKSELAEFIARLNVKGNKTAADIKELKILKSRYHEINKSTAKLASIGGAVALAYMKAVGKRDVNTTRIINAQKEETNGN